MRHIFLFALLCSCLAVRSQVQIAIDTSTAGVEISPMLYGIFYEDINHAADGGIYGELLRNRSFEDSATEADGWEPYLSVSGNVSLTLAREDLLNSVQQQCLHVVTTKVGDSDAGVANGGFWGINAVKGREYTLSLWIKVKKGSAFYALLKGKNGTALYASTRLDVDRRATGWQHITATLTSSVNDPEAVFALTATGNADFFLDMVSLFPPTYHNRPNGLRADLCEMLYDLHPAFMRFPGGCFVEGQDTPDNAFRWQRTIGPIEERPGHDNKNWGYRTSDGLGFHEYLQLAEDLHAKALYVCNIGIWHGGVTPLSEIDMWIDECLAALEYANGAVTTPYGALRAQNGHPEPFNLEYIEIGNENNQDDGAQTSDNYYERYRRFREAILAKYPNMTIIGNVAAWGTDNPRWHTTDKVDLVDEHYYKSPQWFAAHFDKYDAYERTLPAVYCGEYAVTQGFGTIGNLDAALAEAVFMMGFENNSDLVKMSSYAPIFVNENDAHWKPDMIRFNSSSVMGTPSYYVQKLMATNRGHKALHVTQGAQITMPDRAMHTPRSSHVGVATYATQATFRDIRVEIGTQSIAVPGTTASDFLPLTDAWTVSGEGITQTSAAPGSDAIIATEVASRKYAVTLQARKNSGDEGFIIVFNYTDKDNYCWLNFGGTRNTIHCLEQAQTGGRMAVKSVPGSIETGRWYDIRLEVDDNNVVAYLDGERVFDATLTGTTLPGIFTSASIDEHGETMILKIVNTSGTMETAALDLGTFKTVGGELIQLRGATGKEENTLQHPTNVYPTTRQIVLDSTAPHVDIPPYSLNILRLKHK